MTVNEFACVTPSALEVQLDQKGKVVERGGTPKNITQFGIGAMKGFEMALQTLQFHGWPGFQPGDLMSVKLTEMRPPTDPTQSPMAIFAVKVVRPDPIDKAIAASTQKKDDYQFETAKPAQQQPRSGSPITDEDIPF